MKTFGMMAVIAVALLASGCSDSERLATELASANAHVAELDSTLAAVRANSYMESAQVYNLSQTVAGLEGECDSLQTHVAKMQSQIVRLNDNLRHARVEYQQALDSINGVNNALAIDINTMKSELDNAGIRIVASERRINDLIRARDSVYAFVDDIQPWFAYYKHEAERNWLKKLFKAGDAVKPETPEPSFETPAPGMNLEALKP